MKNRCIVLCLVAACCAGAIACVSGTTYQRVYSQPPPAPVAAPPPGAQDQPFYSDLAPYGDWVYVSGPGWVWSPYNMPADWRPYQAGHWVLTDYGWTWASDEEFGWAVYHYGRWHNDGAYGWVWVPGTEWGPAWVAWHEGAGYVGWAPLPWQVTWQAGIGLDWSGVNVNVALGPSAWYFVPARAMVDPGCRRYIVPAAQNVTLIQRTSNVTNYTYVDNRIINQSVRVETIGRAVGHPVQKYHLEQADSPEHGHGGRVQGDSFVVFRPDPGQGAHSQRRSVPPGHDDTRPAAGHHGPDNPWGVPHGHDHPARGMSQPPPVDPSTPADQPAPPQTTPSQSSPGGGQRTGPPPQSHRDDAHDSRFQRAMEKTNDWMQHPNQPPIAPSGPDAPPDPSHGHHGNQPPGQSRGTASGNAPAGPGNAPAAPGNAPAPAGNAPTGNAPPASTGSRPAPGGPSGVSATNPGQDKTPPGKSQGKGPGDSGNKHDKPKPPETPSDKDKKDSDKPKQNS
jgi:hypothetical protein